MKTAHFQRTFSAAHRLASDRGKCSHIHGHNYIVQIEVRVDKSLPDTGFTVPFDVVKKVIDHFDHKLILAETDPVLGLSHVDKSWIARVPGSPSTEFMAQHLAEELIQEVVAAHHAAHELKVASVRVKLYETTSIMAEGEAWYP